MRVVNPCTRVRPRQPSGFDMGLIPKLAIHFERPASATAGFGIRFPSSDQAVATNPASIAERSAWYDERTSGPDATWVKPNAMPNISSCLNSSGVQ